MGAGHGHGTPVEDLDKAFRTPRSVAIALAAVVVVIAVAALVGMWLLRPTGEDRPKGLGFEAPGVTFLHGQIRSIAPLDCDQVGFNDPTAPPKHPSTKAQCGRAKVALTSGTEAGKTVTVDLPQDVRRGAEGLRILVMKVPGEASGSPYSFYDVERGRPLLVMAVVCLAIILVVGRWRGLRALIGLGVAAFVMVKYLLPALLEGHNPVWLGLWVSVAVMIVVLYLAHGVSVRTTTALLGTFVGLAITAVVGAVAVAQVHLSGVSSDESLALQQVAQRLDLHQLLSCGIILAGLGVLNDVTITQGSAIWELRAANPDASAQRLYRQGMSIGRDHIASTIYTIVFAYAGAALTVLLLIALGGMPTSMVLTSSDIAEELVRTMASAIGLVLAVPATTALAVFIAKTQIVTTEHVEPITSRSDRRRAPARRW
jgi:uncharacterized membrane protein